MDKDNDIDDKKSGPKSVEASAQQQAHLKTKDLKDHDELIKLVDRAFEHWAAVANEYTDDVEFSFGDQWSGADIQKRQRAGRPSFTYNLIPAFEHTITNAVRQAPPSITIHAAGDDATTQAAETLSGLIRGVEYESNAQSAYVYALACMVKGGIGAWRIALDEKEDGRIDFLIDSIIDPTALSWDPAARRPDFSDARYCVYRKMMDVGMAKDKWKKYADEIEREASRSDEIELMEVWALTESGCVQYLMTQATLLEINDEYPGTMLPFVMITGERGYYGNQVHFHGVVRSIKECQREYNYLKSEAIAAISNHPKGLVIAEHDALEDSEDQWAQSNSVAQTVLYKKKGSEVTIIPPPEPPVGFMQLADAVYQTMTRITGIYAPSQGEHLDPMSGKAIKYEQAQGSLANYHLLDALNYGLKRTGEIILDMAPAVWDDDAIRIAHHPDGKTESVSVGSNTINGVSNLTLAYGRYGVTISSGPSYATQREALQDKLLDMMKIEPAIAGIIGPWLVQSIDLPGSESVAAALTALQPPAVQQVMAARKDPEGAVAQMAQQINQLQQQLQQAQQAVQAAHPEIIRQQTQIQLKQMELQADAEREQMRIQAEQNRHTTEIMAKAHLQDASEAAEDKREQMRLEAKAHSDVFKETAAAHRQSADQIHDATVLGYEHAHDHETTARQAMHTMDHAILAATITPKPAPKGK